MGKFIAATVINTPLEQRMGPMAASHGVLFPFVQHIESSTLD
jgi:hypothetical protein